MKKDLTEEEKKKIDIEALNIFMALVKEHDVSDRLERLMLEAFFAGVKFAASRL